MRNQTQIWSGALLLACLISGTALGWHALFLRQPEPASVSPVLAGEPIERMLCPGEQVTLQVPVFLPPAPLQADLLFIFDTTGSMEDVIETAQMRALEVMTNLQGLIEDIRFGVVDFRDYPYFPFGKTDDWPYRLRQPLTTQQTEVQARIQELQVGGGADEPEAYTRALYEALTDENIGWRPDARRIIVMFGDSYAHDDDLNAGVPTPQPFRPHQIWRTGSYPPPHLDPGRDGEEATEDDLDFQPVLLALGEQTITLLFIVSAFDANFEGPASEQLLIYWQFWAGMTGPGGAARSLEDLDALPAIIQTLVTSAVRQVNQLRLDIAPSWFETWVTVQPVAYTDIEIPAAGLTRTFEVTVQVPLTTPTGHYLFDLIARADGTVYGRQQVAIVVSSTCFATATPTAEPTPTLTPTRVPLPTLPPRWTVYVPLIANRD